MGSDGWKNLDEVWIPPVEEKGFREEIVIRKPIAPVLVNTAAQADVLPEQYEGEDATVLLADFDEYDGEDATVLLTQEAVFTAWIKRINTGEKVEIDKDMFVIGKSSSADYVIRDNMTVSRKHAAIKKTQDGYYLEDLGSSNHTFIDGVMVTEPTKLINGTMFQLSKEMFEFTIG